MEWGLEKTSGTLRIRNDVTEKNGTESSFTKAINYTGALIELNINKILLIKSMTNFGMLYHPEGIAWSDIILNAKDIYAISTRETFGFPIPVAYKSTLYPYAGYSYLKLDYTDNYTFLPDGFNGHKVYHNYLFGVDQEVYVNKCFRFSIGGW